MSRYRGNKGLPNLIPNILNEFPVHKVFWELCAGHAYVTKAKSRASFTAVVDKDNCLVQGAENIYPAGVVAINDCVISILKELQFAGPSHLIYIDPPYHPEVVKNVKYYYKHIMSPEEHSLMCAAANATNCRVVISHYDCVLYDQLLSGWRKKVINVSYHGYPQKEALYFNYEVPAVVAEINYVGSNKTERQQYKRMAARWLRRLNELPPQVKQLIMTTLRENDSGKSS